MAVDDLNLILRVGGRIGRKAIAAKLSERVEHFKQRDSNLEIPFNNL